MSSSSQAQTVDSIYRDHHRWLRGWLMNKLGCTERAADLAQDTYLRLLQYGEKTGSLPQIREPRAYLSTTAGRLVYDFFPLTGTGESLFGGLRVSESSH